MAAVLYTFLFMLGGAAIIRFQLPRKSPVTRVFLGAALGLLLQMQLPALCAWVFDFSLAAHAAAAVLLLIITGYVFGIIGKLVGGNFKWYVLFFYVLNLTMVSVDLALYVRNYRLDKQNGVL